MTGANKQNIIIYNTTDGKASVSLYAKDGMMWMNQNLENSKFIAHINKTELK
jgi:hypothetical protein